MLDSNMEMGSLQNDNAGSAAAGNNGGGDAPPPPAPELDIMQFARTGDVPGMEKLFESGEFDATYADGEGITPLHVCRTRNCALTASLSAAC